jgi:hypothetical protein
MYFEDPGEDDWFGREEVVRIGSLCEESLDWDKDDTRTEFLEVEEAFEQWNAMQRGVDVSEEKNEMKTAVIETMQQLIRKGKSHGTR